MSTFKDMVEADIEGVFINLEEFGDTHTWNGGRGTGASYEIKAVLDDDVLIKQYTSQFEFFGQDIHMLFSPAKGFKKKPKNGDAVHLDGNLYTVDRIEEDMGMYAIFLTRGKS